MNINLSSNLFLWLLLTLPEMVFSQSADFTIQDVSLKVRSITLAGSILNTKKHLQL
jgi:hypothetical protein